jgi:hypothetical protein
VYDIRAIKESEIMSKERYFSLSESYSPYLTTAILKRLQSSEESLSELKTINWRGNLPIEQVNYYIDRYKILYPNLATYEYIKLAADYLAGAKVRYELDGRFEPVIFSDREHISISFVPPVPGAPISLFGNTLYYRTVPENQSRTHIAPWRAKGFLEINQDNSVKIKITSFGNNEIIGGLHPLRTVFENQSISTWVDADYLVKDISSPVGFIA